MGKKNICPYNNEYCEYLKVSNTVCISCDTYIDSTCFDEDIKVLQEINKRLEEL